MTGHLGAFCGAKKMVAHSEILLSKCGLFREHGEFIDVRLKVGDDEFPAHRIVLAANSDYFHAMFAHGMKESNQEVIELKDENISADTLKIVMDAIYSGEINVDDENVFEILPVADHLQVTSVVHQCCDYLQTEVIQRRLEVQMYARICSIADRHGLSELLEAAQRKMASMYKEICESEEFLCHVDSDQLVTLLRRDDLNTPTESFVLKAVMAWIRYKEEERLPFAGKVIQAVRLGLAELRDVVEELNTEEMQRMPDIRTLLLETFLHSYGPVQSSKFALEQAKPRAMCPVLVAILPQTQMQYFDIQIKMWKPLSSMAQLPEAIACFCSEVCGKYLYVASRKGDTFVIDRYHISLNIWETLPPFCGPTNQIGCLCSIDDHIYAIFHSEAPRRFSIPKNQWQCVAKLSATLNIVKETFCIKSAVVFKSCIYVLHGVAVNRANSTSGVQHSNVFQQVASTQPSFVVSQRPRSVLFRKPASSSNNVNWQPEVDMLYCFDPKQNAWEQKASTNKCHFASSLFVVNDKLFVGGGKCSVNKSDGRPSGEGAAVEVYDEENNSWSVVDQSHIPPNNLGAVELEGRVYFIINCFPFDSGIRIPPEDVYPVSLDEWENLGNVSGNAVLCYLPIKVDKL